MEDSRKVFQAASPEWVAKRIIIEDLRRASVLMGLASTSPRQFLSDFKAAVLGLYGLLREKMWRYRRRIGLDKEELEKYDEFLIDNDLLVKASYSDIAKMYLAILKAVEVLGYTRFEKESDIEGRITGERGEG